MTKVNKKPGQSVAPRANDGALEVYTDKPDFLKGQRRGSENVAMEDLIVPRLELVQPLSPCKDKNESAFIPGAEDGMIFNTVGRQLYGEKVTIVPVFFRKQYLVFRTRKAGGGFRGSFATPADANAHKQTLENPGDHEVIDAAEHFVLVIGDGTLEQAMLTCTKTKMKVSKQLNSLVQMRGEDRWASAYELTTKQEVNDKGKYYNYVIRPTGFVSERVYNKGQELWESITSGERNLRTDTSDIDSTTVGDGDM